MMAKRKYIEDSDEEDEDAPPAKEVKLDREGPQLDSTQRTMVDGNAELGCTSSTERLNRDMQNAHKSLLDPTPTHSTFLARTSMDELQDASLTTPSTQSLGRRTATVLEKAKAKGAKTNGVYGTRRGHESANIFEFNGSSDEEPGGESYSGVELQSSDQAQGKENEAQEPPDTLGNSRGSHPQGDSSNTIPTVPNSTPPQPFNSSAMRTTSDHDHREPYPQSQSDGRMPTPTTPSHSRSTASSSYKATQKEAMIQPPAVPNLRPHKLEAHQRPTLSGSRIASSKSTTANTRAGINEAIDASQGSERAEPTSLPTFHTAGLLRPMVVLPEALDDSLPVNQVSMPAPDVQLTRTVKISDEKKLKQQNQTAADDLGSDDISIGLPKEQYKPRPSRSRGTQNDDEIIVPTDYSKRPEAVAMGKMETKKRKRKQSLPAEATAKAERGEDADEKDVDDPKPGMTILEVKSPGSPTNAENQVEQVGPVNLPVSKTETGEIDHHSTQGSIKKSPKPKRQRGRPKKATDVDVPAPGMKQGVRKDDVKSKEHTSSTNRKPAKSGQSKKSQSVVNSDSESEEEDMSLLAKCDQPNKDPQSIVNSDSESEAVTSRKISKRSRSGKKSQLVLDSGSDDEAEPPEEHNSQSQGHYDPTSENNALTESSGNRGRAKLTSKTTNNAGAAQSEPLPPVTPPKAAASTPKGTVKHSPISAGLSKYRVGLSKRARIEPLLRIVRK